MDVSSIRFPPGAKSISPDMSPAEKVKALKHCCKFFSQLEQDQEDEKKIYLPFCIYISEKDFISELTDTNAKIHLGCIFADIYRLHAPENPFPAEKTKNVLIFMAEQLCNLQNVKSALFSKAYHILENVSTVKSYNICLDLDSGLAEEVFLELFKVLFSVVNSSHDVQLKTRMLDVMAWVVLDSDFISQKLLCVILECLLEKNRRMNPSAFELCQNLLRKTSGTGSIEDSVAVFFQNALLNENEGRSTLTRNWPVLLSELYRISSSFFTNMVPQLELKLRTDNLKERSQVVRLLAGMFSERDSVLAIQYPNLWTCFLGRFHDIEAAIRSDCVRFCSEMIINLSKDDEKSQSMMKELIQLMKLRRHDADEEVRTAVVITIRAIAMHDLKLLSDELIGFLRERLMDKKQKVRETAVRAVADVCKKVSSDGMNQAKAYRIPFQALQSQLLHVYYTQSFDDCVLIERILVSSMIKYSLPDSDRMQRFVELFCTVDNHALKAIDQMFKRQKILRGLLNNMLQCLVSEVDSKERALWETIRSISSHLHAPIQAREHLKKFVLLVRDDEDFLQWLRYLVSKDYTCKKVALAVRDILKKLEKVGAKKTVRQTVQQFLERLVLVPILVDSSSFFILVKIVHGALRGDAKFDDQNNRGADLLCLLAKHDPSLFARNECFEIILEMLRGKDEYIVEKSLLIFFHAAPIIEEKFEAVRSILLPELKAIAKTSQPYQAKYAVRIISSFSTVCEKPLMQVYYSCKEMAIQDCLPNLKLRTALTSLGCVAQFLPSEAGKDIKGFIAAIVVKKIIMQTHSKPVRKKDLKWCQKSELSEETATKLVAMKCMVRWLCGLKSNDSDCCGSTLRLLQHMMHNDGDLMKCGRIPKADMAHLRLQAALCVLKIASCAAYKDMISHSIFMEFAVLLMDEVREVRQILLNKLYKALFCFEVHVSFLSLFWVISQEKFKEHRDHGAALYRQLVMRYRTVSKEKSITWSMPEYAISFMIHLLANDPDVPVKEDIPMSILSRIKDSINFMLDPLLTRDHPESFGFIKRLAEMIKRTRLEGDADSHLRSQTLYKVCDLVLQSVLTKSAQYAVGIIEPPDCSMQKFLPSRLYSRPESEENDQNYLPESFKIKSRFVPVGVAASENPKNPIRHALPSGKKSAKSPRKVVAVTKVSLPYPVDTGTMQSYRQCCIESNISRNAHRNVSGGDCSSDEESLAAKRAKLTLERRTPDKKKESNLADDGKETKSEKSSDCPHGTSTNKRPKRASAGRKMFDYLRAAKKNSTS